jgi:hypothetical protein
LCANEKTSSAAASHPPAAACVHRGGRTYGILATALEVRDEYEEEPHPTIARGAGRYTNLTFPNAPEDDERGGGA